MSVSSSVLTGQRGEKIAEMFLLSRGFKIISRNYKTPLGEIDIITSRGGYTVFVEVKSRVSERFGTPLESITPHKKAHIIRNCLYYLNKHKLQDSPCRIDLVSVKLSPDGKLESLKHIENAIETT